VSVKYEERYNQNQRAALDAHIQATVDIIVEKQAQQAQVAQEVQPGAEPTGQPETREIPETTPEEA